MIKLVKEHIPFFIEKGPRMLGVRLAPYAAENLSSGAVRAVMTAGCGCRL
jgi:hypothetical protein